MIDAKRRILLKGSLAAGSVGVAIGAGLLSPAWFWQPGTRPPSARRTCPPP